MPTSAGAADFGVVPVENSSEGVVTRSLDLFLTTPLVIVGETSLYVRHNLLRQTTRWKASRPSARIRRRSRNATAGSAGTCRWPSGGRWRATPRARAWRASTASWPASPANARPASTACTSSRPRSRTTRTTAPASRSSPHPTAHPRRRPPATTAPASWSRCRTGPGAVHDMLVPLKAHGVSMTPLRVPPGALGPVGVLLLHRPRGPPRAAACRRWRCRSCARPAPFFKLLGTYPVDVPLGSDIHVPATRRDRLRPDGRLVRARAQARRARRSASSATASRRRPPSRREAPRRHRHRRGVGAARGVRLGHRAASPCRWRRPRPRSRRSATWSSRACCSWTSARPSATWSMPRAAC